MRSMGLVRHLRTAALNGKTWFPVTGSRLSGGRLTMMLKPLQPAQSGPFGRNYPGLRSAATQRFLPEQTSV